MFFATVHINQSWLCKSVLCPFILLVAELDCHLYFWTPQKQRNTAKRCMCYLSSGHLLGQTAKCSSESRNSSTNSLNQDGEINIYIFHRFYHRMLFTSPRINNSCKYNNILHEMAISSVQRVPEPDPIPGISFATRPDPIQFWKSSGSG